MENGQILYRSKAEKTMDEASYRAQEDLSRWVGQNWEAIANLFCWYFMIVAVYLVISVIVEIAKKEFDGISGNFWAALFWPYSLWMLCRLNKVTRFVTSGKWEEWPGRRSRLGRF